MRPRGAAGWLVLAALLAACRAPAPRVEVGRILVDGAQAGDGLEVPRDAVREALQAALRSAPPPGLRLAPRGGALLRAHAMLGRVPPGPGGLPVLVLRLQLEPGAGATRGVVAEITVEQRAESVDEQPLALVDAAARAALARLAAVVALDTAPVDQVLAALEGTDRELRLRALGVLAARREPAALEALLRALQDPDEAVALRAVGALVALGDPRGVRALTDLTHRRSPAFVRQIVYAVAAIGGREAEAYLFTVATGHPDPGVQEAARRAQDELAARAVDRAERSEAQPAP